MGWSYQESDWLYSSDIRYGWAQGYFHGTLDPETGIVTATDTAYYGSAAGQKPVQIYNAYESPDEPGEWYYDQMSGRLYIYPFADTTRNSTLRMTSSNFDLISVKNASYLNLEGLTVTSSKKNGIVMDGVDHCVIDSCTLTDFEERAISIDNATHTLLMRKADGNHALYTFGNYSASAGAPAAKLIYEIPAEANALIAEAVSFVFSRFDPILYIATRSAIYKVIFTTGSVNFDPAPVFTAPAGEHITLARLYLQGYYAMENYDGSSTLPSNASLAWSSRAVTVVTSKDDGNDKIHVVPQINFGSGQLDQPNALVFDGFGKILDFTVAGLYK